MNFLKSITAAALLATAISTTNVIAADDYGISGTAGALKFTLTTRGVAHVKAADLDDSGNNAKKKDFAEQVYTALRTLGEEKAIDDALAAKGNATTAVDLDGTFNFAADWTDSDTVELATAEITKIATAIAAELGLKDADQAAGEALKASRPSLMVRLHGSSEYVRLGDVADVKTLKGAVVEKDAGVGDDSTFEMPLKDYYAAQLRKLGADEHSALAVVMKQKEKHEETRERLETAEQDITNITRLLKGVRIDTTDKTTIQSGLARLVDDLRVATEEARKPKITVEQQAKMDLMDATLSEITTYVPLDGVNKADVRAVVGKTIELAGSVVVKNGKIKKLEAQLAARAPATTTSASGSRVDPSLQTPSLSGGLNAILGGTSGGSRTAEAARRSRHIPDASLTAPSSGGTLTATAPLASLSKIEQGVVGALPTEQQKLYHAHRTTGNKSHGEALAAAKANTPVA